MSDYKRRMLTTFIMTLLLSASLTSCGRKGQDQERGELISSDGGTAPPVLPRDVVEVLLDQVESGDLTLAEGVTENLKLMAGEIEYETLYGEENLRLESG